MSERLRDPLLGESIIYCDEGSVDRPALITAVWSPGCINLVFVSGDDSRTDNYGRQIERVTSLQHVSEAGAHGLYWRFAEEERKPFAPPQQV